MFAIAGSTSARLNKLDSQDYDKMMELEKNYKKQVDPKDKPSMKSTDEDDIIPTIDDFDVDLEEEEEE